MRDQPRRTPRWAIVLSLHLFLLALIIPRIPHTPPVRTPTITSARPLTGAARPGPRRTRARPPRQVSATEMGLLWLASHQDRSGRWDGDGFMKHDPPHAITTGAATLDWVDPGLTGLATLAFLGGGHTHRYGRFKDTVRRAIRAIIEIQSADGLVGGTRGRYMYNHAICALALSEAYGMTRSPLVESAAKRALAYLIAARDPGAAWRYRARGGQSDISVTGWCVMALVSAREARLHVEGRDAALRRARDYIERGTDPRYRESDALAVDTARTHERTHTPTAIATLCRVYFGYGKNDARLLGGANVLSRALPGEGRQLDYYYAYYGTLAMFQMGGEHWKRWNSRMKRSLVHRQRDAGSARGSWDPIDAWGFAGGRVYATAINVLTLQTYYAYSRSFR